MTIPLKNNENSAILNVDQFSTWELDTLCSGTFQTRSAKEEQLRIGKYLINEYQFGSDKTTPDAWKVHDLRKKILNEDDDDTNPEPRPYPFSSDFFYRFHAWVFTGLRLLIVRIHRFFVYANKPFLPKFFPYLGLSNGITFLFDVGVVFKNTFFGKKTSDDKKQNRSVWQRGYIRFKNSLIKDTFNKSSRLYRILNDLVWFIINLTLILITGPLVPLLSVLGFLYDALHEGGWMVSHHKRHTQLINKLDATATNLKEQQLSEPKNLEIGQKIVAIENMKKNVIKERFIAVRRQAYITFCCTLLTVGMALLLYPPAALPAAFIIGSTIALVAGSVIYGIGRRSYLLIEAHHAKIREFFKSPLDTLLNIFHLKKKTKQCANSNNQSNNKPFNTIQIKACVDKFTKPKEIEMTVFSTEKEKNSLPMTSLEIKDQSQEASLDEPRRKLNAA